MLTAATTSCPASAPLLCWHTALRRVGHLISGNVPGPGPGVCRAAIHHSDSHPEKPKAPAHSPGLSAYQGSARASHVPLTAEQRRPNGTSESLPRARLAVKSPSACPRTLGTFPARHSSYATGKPGDLYPDSYPGKQQFRQPCWGLRRARALPAGGPPTLGTFPALSCIIISDMTFPITMPGC